MSFSEHCFYSTGTCSHIVLCIKMKEILMVVHTVIPALERLRQEDGEYKASLGYKLLKLFQNKTKQRPH